MKLGFRSKIYLGIFSFLLLLGSVICFVVSRITTDALLEENRNRGISIVTNLADRVAEPILAMDFLRMKTIVDETVRLSDDISYTFVMDAAGDTLAHSFKKGFPYELKNANPIAFGQPYHIRLLDTGEHLIYDYAAPVIIDNSRFGIVRIGLERTKIQRAIRQLVWYTVLTTGAVILIAGFCGTLFARQFTRRIKLLYQSSEQAISGNLEIHTAPLLKKNCWQIMDCQREECPAYNKLNHRCWYLAGTQCPTCVEGTYAKKIQSCRNCIVYRTCSGDEIQSLAESFDSLIMTLNGHLTELKFAEKTLTEQRLLLRMILDAIPDAISLQDNQLAYRAANRTFCEMLDRPESEIIGKVPRDLFPAALVPLYEQEDRRVLETGEALFKENNIQTHGKEKWLHVMKIPVLADDNKILGILCNCRDITDLKKMQEQLTLAQKMESVGQLTAGIAHEINTPLGIILGYAQLLMEDVEPESQIHEDLRTVVKQSRICRKIVRDLLNFSRHTESTLSAVDINSSIKDVISVVEHTFSLDNVTITTTFDDNLPPVKGDGEKIKQVFINLLSNAHYAIGADGAIHIRTDFRAAEKEVLVYVVDTGKGIPADCIDRIFDPFYTTKPVGTGTGLGLSVTFGIIKEHGGRIEVESPPLSLKIGDGYAGTGALFIIHLPVGGYPLEEEKRNGNNHRT
jgi:two-component system, NtrC family, sensor kinase